MRLVYVCAAMILSNHVWAQSPAVPVQPTRAVPLEEFVSNRPSSDPTAIVIYEYNIGIDELIEVNVIEDPEFGVVSRVTAGGKISMPLIGPIDDSDRAPQEVDRSN